MRYLTIAIMAVALQACVVKPPTLPGPPENAPPLFLKGWQDGCDTGLASHGSSSYRMYYSFTQDPDLILNPVYYKAWKDSENYCRTFIFQYSLKTGELRCNLEGFGGNLCDQDPAYDPFHGGAYGGPDGIKTFVGF